MPIIYEYYCEKCGQRNFDYGQAVLHRCPRTGQLEPLVVRETALTEGEAVEANRHA